MGMKIGIRAVGLAWLASTAVAAAFVNWESPHVHPLESTPDGRRLLAVNTPDHRLEVLSTEGETVVPIASVPVGLAPVAVRARDDGEAWVVNHVSDTVSVVDLNTLNVIATLPTADEPADVVFAGDPQRAFVSCSQANRILVFDPAALDQPPVEIELQAEEPRALAVSPDGLQVYAAMFESGNGTTILGGGILPNRTDPFPPNVVSDAAGPYAGLNPPPNVGTTYVPPVGEELPRPPKVGLIVRHSDDGRWRDDNGADWTPWVSGEDAAASGRPVGWTLLDRDVAVIDTATLEVDWVERLMNLNMAIGVRPTDGQLAVIGTDATNEVRFEPNLNGRFLRVLLAIVDPSGATPSRRVDLNPHLDYTTSSVPPSERERSIGDPRALVWSADASAGYVAGLGSDNVVVIESDGRRGDEPSTIEVGEGPTGLVLDEVRGRLYVLNRFEASLSVVDLASREEIDRVGWFDPSPDVIRIGRRHLYSTHATSGLGHLSCASCHVDARMDRLAWDLGNPAGAMKALDGQNLGMDRPGLDDGFQDWHPMKGPMTTQTLRDIIGKEPLHWRGDKAGLEEFNAAYVDLQGADSGLTGEQMQEFEDFLATVHYPPNPFRELDNSLPVDLPLPEHFEVGRFGPPGLQLPDGNAQRGLDLFRPPNLLEFDNFACSTCHTLPTGVGADATLTESGFVPLEPGPNGERHHALVARDGLSNLTAKVPQLRNLYEKVGMDVIHTESRAGFGFIQDGVFDSISRFVSQGNFDVESPQDVADLVAFLLAFSGSDLPRGSPVDPWQPPGPDSQDTHAAVGTQLTVTDVGTATPAQAELLGRLLALADAGRVGLVARGRVDERARGFSYLGGGTFQSDRAAEVISTQQLLLKAGPGNELTFTAVVDGTEERIGIDRDADGALDGDERTAGTDPADPTSVPTP